MTHDTIAEFGTSPTHQRDFGSIKDLLFQRRGDWGFEAPLSSFQEAGLPIPVGGTKDKRQVASSRTEGSLYRQSPIEFDFSPETIGQLYGSLSECFGHTGSRSLSEKKGAWLSGVVRDESSCFTALIGYLAASCRRSIGFWFQRRFGLRWGRARQ